MKKNILVFPCGSEIGLEIFRSLCYSRHFNLIGASSIEDHGQFVYENYIGNFPFYDDENFIPALNKLIHDFKIDVMYPTMDSVITKICNNRNKINCTVIGPDAETSEICLSKSRTYDYLKNYVPVPFLYKTLNDVSEYPVFLKPDIGYSGRGTKKAMNLYEAKQHLLERPGCLIMEFLPGDEYTIDCFTDVTRNLLFSGARIRQRISNGISVNTTDNVGALSTELTKTAIIINKVLNLRGAWFFQMKKDQKGNLKLMEVAARLGGSSGLFRSKGVNFAMLTIWDALGFPITVQSNDYVAIMDRSLSSKFKLKLNYSSVYVDFDDTLIIEERVNKELVSFLYQCFNRQIKLICISRHKGNLEKQLKKFRLLHLFDEIISLDQIASKADFIKSDSILIDDSYRERLEVQQKLGIPVFAPDMIDALL